MIIGYARVSSSSQNLDRQINDLEQFGCDKIFSEKQSGKNFKERTIYNSMRSKLRFGDVLVVHDLARFGRNKEEIKHEWEWLTKNEVDIVVLNMPILDTRKYKDLEGIGQLIADIVLSLLSWMVEEDREQIRIAQREGITLAKAKGKYKGKQRQYHSNAEGKNKVIYDAIVSELKKKTSVMEIHKKTGVSRNTIYKIRKEIHQ